MLLIIMTCNWGLTLLAVGRRVALKANRRRCCFRISSIPDLKMGVVRSTCSSARVLGLRVPMTGKRKRVRLMSIDSHGLTVAAGR